MVRVAASRLHDQLQQIGALQGRLNGAIAIVIALVVGTVVLLPALWATSQHLNTIAHEGGHALMGALMGRRVTSVTMKPAGTGLTITEGAPGLSVVLFQLFGYFSPGLFGLGAAKMIALGHIVAVLWVFLVGLVILLVVARGFFAPLCIVCAGVLLYLAAWYAAVGLQVLIAYGLTWFLLISGFVQVIRHGRAAGDAGLLRTNTHLPKGLWSLLWLIGSTITLILGATLLV
jgi:hypothetical protein